jgi:ABC-2 type transport system permease protein
MTALVRAELLQLRATRATWALLGLAASLCLAWVLAALARVGGIAAPPRGTGQLRDEVIGAAGLGLLPVLLLGVLAVTGEFHHRTVTSAFLAVPARSRLLAAKAAAVALTAPVVAVVLMALLYAVGAFSGAVALTFDGRLLQLVPRMLVTFACWALLGVGIGVLVRNQTVAVLLPVLWFGVVEQLAPSYPALAWLLPWLPGGLTAAIGGGRFPGVLPAWAAVLVLIGYGLALFIFGARRISRPDVT